MVGAFRTTPCTWPPLIAAAVEPDTPGAAAGFAFANAGASSRPATARRAAERNALDNETPVETANRAITTVGNVSAEKPLRLPRWKGSAAQPVGCREPLRARLRGGFRRRFGRRIRPAQAEPAFDDPLRRAEEVRPRLRARRPQMCHRGVELRPDEHSERSDVQPQQHR